MKSILRSIKPYWLYLILTKHKTIEVAKNFPKSEGWNGIVEMYCSKDMQSFNRIPGKDRVWMSKYVGKVACRFVCDKVDKFHDWELSPQGKFQDMEQERFHLFLRESCLTFTEVCEYRKNMPYYKPLCGWHISDLKIYDKPRELSEFVVADKEAIRRCEHRFQSYYSFTDTGHIKNGFGCDENDDWCFGCKRKPLVRPPQSWCYVESE